MTRLTFWPEECSAATHHLKPRPQLPDHCFCLPLCGPSTAGRGHQRNAREASGQARKFAGRSGQGTHPRDWCCPAPASADGASP